MSSIFSISGTLEQPTPWSIQRTTYPNILWILFCISFVISSALNFLLSIGGVKISSLLAFALLKSSFCFACTST